jgi:hypothetical protein
MASKYRFGRRHATYPSKTIVVNAVNSQHHTTLVAAVKAAGLAGARSGAGAFTVFGSPMKPSPIFQRARHKIYMFSTVVVSAVL